MIPCIQSYADFLLSAYLSSLCLLRPVKCHASPWSLLDQPGLIDLFLWLISSCLSVPWTEHFADSAGHYLAFHVLVSSSQCVFKFFEGQGSKFITCLYSENLGSGLHRGEGRISGFLGSGVRLGFKHWPC